MLAAWTTEAAPDPFDVVAGGRSLFHIDDLLALSRLLRRSMNEGADGVKEIAPHV
jgi:hypothetical protein